MTVKNMGEASKTIAEFRPTTLALRDGVKVVVDELEWTSWRELWLEIQDVVATGYTLWSSQQHQAEAGAFYQESARPSLRKSKEGDEWSEPDAEIVKAITQQAHDLYEGARVSLQDVVKGAVGKLEAIPELVERIILGSVKVDGELVDAVWLKQRSMSEVLAMFRESIYLNFVQNGEVLDFFGDAQKLVTAVTGRSSVAT